MSDEKDLKQSEIFDPAIYNGEALLPPATLAQIENDERQGFWIAKRLKEKKPDVYNLVKACRANGWSIKRTMDYCFVGYNTVVEIDKVEKEFFKKIKDELSTNCYTSASQLLEIVKDSLGNLAQKTDWKPEELRSLGELFSKLVDKGQLLSGEATEIIETSEAPKFTSWKEMMNTAIDGEVVDGK